MADIKFGIELNLIDKVTRGLDALKAKTESVGNKFLAFGKNILASKLGIAAISAAVVLSVKEFAIFEQKMVDVINLFAGSREDLKKFSDQVLELTQRIPQGAQDLASGLFDVISAGVGLEDATMFLEAAAKLATAGVTDTKTAVAGLTATMNAYQIEAKDVTKVSDMFFTAQTQGSITIEQLSNSIGKLAPVAKSAGVKLKEMLAAIAQLTSAGTKPEEAMTMLRAVMISILAPTAESAKLAKALRIEFGKEAIEAKGLHGVLKDVYDKTGGNTEVITALIPRVEALTAVLTLGGSKNKEFAQSMTKIGDATGSTTKAFENQMGTMSAQLKILGNNISTLTKQVIGVFAPLITKTLEWVNFVFDLVGSIGGAVKKIVLMGNEVFKITDLIGKAVNKTANFVSKLIDPISKAAKKTADSITGLFKKNGDAINKTVEAAAEKTIETEKNVTVTTSKEQKKRAAAAAETMKKLQELTITDSEVREKISNNLLNEFLNREQIKREEGKTTLADEIQNAKILLENENLIAADRAKIIKHIADLESDARSKKAEETKKLKDIIIEVAEEERKRKTSIEQQFADTSKGILKKMVIDYIKGLQAADAAKTASGLLTATASKNPIMAGQVLAQGAATQVAHGVAISTIEGLRKGGIVTGDGLYRIGEQNKKEAVIPLESSEGRSTINRALGQITNQKQNINVTLEIDGYKLAEIMTNYSSEATKTGRF